MTVTDDSHNHIISNVDGLQTALNAKQDAGSAIANSLALNGKADSDFVQSQNNSTLNGDTRNTRGPTRLFRRDGNSDYSVQTDWTGTYWRLRGYNGDTFHAGCQVSYADSAGTTTNSTNATNATNIDVAADNSDMADNYVIFTEGTGNRRPKRDTALLYNPLTNTLTADVFSGTAINATNFNVAADNTTNSNHYLIFTNGATGNQRPNSDNALKYNPATNRLITGEIQVGEIYNNDYSLWVDNTTSQSNFSVINLAQSGTQKAVIRYDSNGDSGFAGVTNSHSWRFKVDSSGNATATGDVTAYSDISLKTNIKPITEALNKVDEIDGVTFERVDMESGVRHAGVIAQDVQKVLPAVVRGDDGKLTVAYGNIVGLLVEAIKELRQEINTLKGA